MNELSMNDLNLIIDIQGGLCVWSLCHVVNPDYVVVYGPLNGPFCAGGSPLHCASCDFSPMGDSDDEFDRRRRDKFRRERSDMERSREREERRRDDWPDR